MEPTSYLTHLDADARALLAAAWTDPMLTVPTCPEWTLSDLAAHMGSALHWVDAIVRTRANEYVEFPVRPETWEDISAWFEVGLESLIAELRTTDPDTPVWNWVVMGPGAAVFWYRRMAHEASIHRWDAEHVVRAPDPIDTTLAADGLDEYLMIRSKWLEFTSKPELAGTLGLEATDAPFTTTVELAPDGLHRHDGLEGAACVVRAGASDLLLWLVGRKALLDPDISFEGDVSVAALWSEVEFG